MAPSIIDPYSGIDNHTAEINALKAKAAPKQADMNGTAQPPPVADDYMYDFKFNHPLPTTDVLGMDIPKDCNAQMEADGIVERLSDALASGNADAFADTFLDYGE
jgi:hypothetical protein